MNALISAINATSALIALFSLGNERKQTLLALTLIISLTSAINASSAQLASTALIAISLMVALFNAINVNANHFAN